eukprot:2704611-Prymnesium_polylepis.1
MARVCPRTLPMARVCPRTVRVLGNHVDTQREVHYLKYLYLYDASLRYVCTSAAFALGRRVSLVPRSRCACLCAVCRVSASPFLF